MPGILTTRFNGGLCNRLSYWLHMYACHLVHGHSIVIDWPELRDDSIRLPATTYGKDCDGIPLNTVNLASWNGVNPGSSYRLTSGFDFNRSLYNLEHLQSIQFAPQYIDFAISLLTTYYG